MIRKAFTHTGLSMRVVFGSGRITELATEVDRLALSRVAVISTPQQLETAELAADLVGAKCHGVYPHAAMHVPTSTADDAIAYVRHHAIDGCIAVGGGSAIGLAKAVALKIELPIIAVPTTYAGSEMTPIWGMTSEHAKTTGRSTTVLPKSVIYDPELTLTLPARQSAVSGLNAMAHAVEALYAPDGSPIVDALAVEAARSLYTALPAIIDDPHGIDPRCAALYGAWLAGACLAVTTMSLHHKLCHILGGAFDLPHAETHAVVLPRVAEFNLPAAESATAHLTLAFGTTAPATALQNLTQRIGVPQSLREIGMPETGIERVVDEAVAHPYANPRAIDDTAIRSIIKAAYTGAPLSEM